MKTKRYNITLLLITLGLVSVTSCSKVSKFLNQSTDTVRDTVYMLAPEENIEEENKRQEILDSNVQPLTQYALVEVTKYGASFRSNMETVLKNIGFNIKTYPEPDDEMESHIFMKASRDNNGGTTTIIGEHGEDVLLTINFAYQSEVDDFVESMVKAGYKKEGHIYANPHNQSGFGCIYVKVKGLKVTLISPFEMLPNNF